MISISVVVPVYNCEQYIAQSIRSIQRQTINNIEIICIDDGSKDCSVEIIREFQKKDERIILYSQNNQGSGAARNLGMKYANGEFIAFLDADDYYLDADALESMYMHCKKCGVSVCGTCIRIQRGSKLVLDKGCEVVAKAAEKSDVLLYEDFQFDYGYYGFIFERKLIIENKLQFPLYRRFQDPVFFTRVMYTAGEFCFINKALYVYRAPNVMTRFHAKNTIDLLYGLLDNLRFAKKNGLGKLFDHTKMRLEQEYVDIIVRNLSVESLAVLLEINQIIGEDAENIGGPVLPLQRIIENSSKMENLYGQALIGKLINCKKIYPYGAGKVCEDFLGYLEENDRLKKVAHILVTDIKDNPNKLYGVPIMELKDYRFEEGDLIVITVVGIHQTEVLRLLQERQINHYVMVNSCLFSNIEMLNNNKKEGL